MDRTTTVGVIPKAFRGEAIMKGRNLVLLSALAAAMSLTACGGGGAGGPTGNAVGDPRAATTPSTPVVTPSVGPSPTAAAKYIVNKIVPVTVTMPVQQTVPNARAVTTNTPYRPYTMIQWATADFRGTGRDDVLVVPEFSYQPLPLEIWLNNGDGTWDTHGAAKMFPQGVPTVTPTYPVVADLNGDGKPDIIITSYHELGDCSLSPSPCGVGPVQYYESQPDGTYKDASAKLFNMPGSEHPTVVSTNGDGVNDVLLAASGLHLLKGDGHGNFTDDTYRLPSEIRGISTITGDNFKDWQATQEVTGGVSQQVGRTTVMNLHGASKPTLVTASYGYDNGTQAAGTNAGSNGTQSIRMFEQQADGTYAKVAQIIQSQDRSDNCAVVELVPAPFMGGKYDDLMVVYETYNGHGTIYTCGPQLFVNNGDGTFRLIASPLAGDYTWADEWGHAAPKGFMAINNNGSVDLFTARNNQVLEGTLTTGQAWLWHNQGGGSFVANSITVNGEVQSLQSLDAALGAPYGNMAVIPVLMGKGQLGVLLVEADNPNDYTVPDASGNITNFEIRLHTITKL